MPISFSIPSSLSISGATTTAALTIGSLTGVLKASSGVVSAATSGTDYAAAGAITTSGLTMSTAKMLGRATGGTGAIEEIAVTGSGSAVLANTPTLITPIIGAATGTSLATSGSITAGTTLADQSGALAAQRNALSVAQALNFDGSSVAATATLASAPGTEGVSVVFDFDVPTSGVARGIFHLATARGITTAYELYAELSSANALTIYHKGVAGGDYIGLSKDISSGYSGRVKGVFTRSGSNAILYLNGVNTSASTIGPVGSGAWADTINGTLLTIGRTGDVNPFNGVLVPPVIYNRALSASEALSLYQSGAVESADLYGSGVNTTITAGAFVYGKKYRIVSVGTTSFTSIGASANTVGVEFTATGVGTGTGTATAIGVLIAPEVNAAGAGLEWLDISGNRAHIVLPTSGVSWALPSAQQIIIEASTNTATNQQLGAASLIDTNKQWRIQSWTINCSTGTPTISLGNASAGAQYVSGLVLAAGNNDITLLTRFPTTANLWCNSNTTATLIHRIVLVPAN